MNDIHVCGVVFLCVVKILFPGNSINHVRQPYLVSFFFKKIFPYLSNQLFMVQNTGLLLKYWYVKDYKLAKIKHH